MVSTTTVLHLVRHGESGWNAQRRCQGQSVLAPALTGRGRAQARTTAELLAELAPHARLVVSSDIARARETALIIAATLGLPLRFDTGLREQNLGSLEGRRFDGELGGGTVQDAIDELWRDTSIRPPRGESIHDLHARVHATLARLGAGTDAGELIVVTHGGPVRVSAGATCPARLDRRAVENASVTSLRFTVPAWQARAAS